MFSEQLREARENAIRDSEAFDGIIHAVERLGSFLAPDLEMHRRNLGGYKSAIQERVTGSALAEDIPRGWPGLHTPFSRLYDLVTQARNDAVHQGAFARRLTGHAIELSLMLEDALRRSMDNQTVGDYMVRNPVCAELWQPVSFVRQQMLANSFSFMPVMRENGWHLVSDLDLIRHLRTKKREKGLVDALRDLEENLCAAVLCTVDTVLKDAVTELGNSQRPLLVHRAGEQSLIGIVTPFDLL